MPWTKELTRGGKLPDHDHTLVSKGFCAANLGPTHTIAGCFTSLLLACGTVLEISNHGAPLVGGLRKTKLSTKHAPFIKKKLLQLFSSILSKPELALPLHDTTPQPTGRHILHHVTHTRETTTNAVNKKKHTHTCIHIHKHLTTLQTESQQCTGMYTSLKVSTYARIMHARIMHDATWLCLKVGPLLAGERASHHVVVFARRDKGGGNERTNERRRGCCRCFCTAYYIDCCSCRHSLIYILSFLLHFVEQQQSPVASTTTTTTSRACLSCASSTSF